MRLSQNLVNGTDGESGMIRFEDGAIAIWGCDEPLYVVHPDGSLTREWQADRFPSERTQYGLYLDSNDEPFDGNTSEGQDSLIRRVLYGHAV